MNKKISNKQRGRIKYSLSNVLYPILALFLLLPGCQLLDGFLEEHENIDLINAPEGFKVTKMADGLHLPTAVTWDDQGNMYVAEAGGGLFPEMITPMRIIQVKDDGTKVEVADLSNKGIEPAIVGLSWHNGYFYITHRAEDLTGAVSRVSMDGSVELLFKGIIDNQAEHQINDIRVGPDGMMYVAVGLAGNAGVMGPSVAPWIMESPDVRAIPCQDIVLVGRNYKTADFRTDDPTDSVKTGAYVPFGEETHPGQVIQGVTLCGGSILKFDPNNPSNISVHAWGFRNLIGLAWDSMGKLYAAENGYDVRGSRPVLDEFDASLRITEGMWYGVPDFSAGREPLTDPKFEVPDSLQAGVFINGEFIGKDLGFVINHEASGLTPPDPSVVLSRHEFNSSPSMMDVAPASWGDWANHVFIAEWGDLAPPTNPLRGKRPAGSQIVRVDPETGQLVSFISNIGGGPASARGAQGEGLDRPFDVQFGPDGAMYIIDFGVVKIDMSKKPPYVFKENTGAIWKVIRKE